MSHHGKVDPLPGRGSDEAGVGGDCEDTKTVSSGEYGERPVLDLP